MDLSQETDDHALLRRYAQTNSQEAFAALVERHTDLVWSAAMRLTGGDPHAAEDVAQTVFAALAVKAGGLKPDVILPGWLLNATRYAAVDLRRSEGRRKRHERNAAMTNGENARTRAAADATAGHDDREQTWSRVAPVLDEALAQLSDSLRGAVVLRFFERKSMRDVAGRLGISEAAARQRVCRGVEQLRDALGRKSVVVPAAALAALLASNAVQAAPPGVASTLASGASLASAAGAKALGASAPRLWIFSTLVKGAAAACVVMALLGSGAALVAWELAGTPGEETVQLAPPAHDTRPDRFIQLLPADGQAALRLRGDGPPFTAGRAGFEMQSRGPGPARRIVVNFDGEAPRPTADAPASQPAPSPTPAVSAQPQ